MIAVILGVAAAVAMSLISNEVRAWMPTLARWVARRAAASMRDVELRERYIEEWGSAVAELPGPLSALYHAVSLFWRARDVELAAGAEVTEADVDERFAALQQAVQDFSDAFDAACDRRGVTLEQLAEVSKISVRELRALSRGEFSKIQMGHLRIFAFLPDQRRMFGPELGEVHRLYAEAVSKYGGLPPNSSPSPSVLRRLVCLCIGHVAYTRHIHKAGVPFHWVFSQCERCSQTSVMRSEPCDGKTSRVRLDFDAPVLERYNCEAVERWCSPSLEDGNWRPHIGGVEDKKKHSLGHDESMS